MHAADAVLVYLRHAYGEGLPVTIYLGFASRTPLVVSDHPMFVAYLRDCEDVLVAPERAPEALGILDHAMHTRRGRGAELIEWV